MKLSVFLGFAMALSGCAVTSQKHVDDVKTVEQETAEFFKATCSDDNGELWGVSLCGPLLVANPVDRSIWATTSDNDGVLISNGENWTGVLPTGVPIANTATSWSGMDWVMLMSPLPGRDLERQVLVMHEAWHRIQDQIGLEAQAADAMHLNSEVGRTLMRLEMRALAKALESSNEARDVALAHALEFRTRRAAMSPNALDAENALDRNEGLASYTGVKLGAGENAVDYTVRRLNDYDKNQALTRTYAYATGPAYGLLLDDYLPDWRRKLGERSPAEHLKTIIDASKLLLVDRNFENNYNLDQIQTEERARARRLADELDELRRQFTKEPRLILPLRQMQFEFDPNGIVPIEGVGSVYETLVLRDQWGEMKANAGAMITESFTELIAPAPNEDGVSGPGWQLTLNEGYAITRDVESGVFSVTGPTEAK